MHLSSKVTAEELQAARPVLEAIQAHLDTKEKECYNLLRREENFSTHDWGQFAALKIGQAKAYSELKEFTRIKNV